MTSIMTQRDFQDIFNGAGYSCYTFDSKEEAISILRKNGFKNATYRKNLHGGSNLSKRIRKVFKRGFTVMECSGVGITAYIGYHDIGTSEGPQEVLWVRIIGTNELK